MNPIPKSTDSRSTRFKTPGVAAAQPVVVAIHSNESERMMLSIAMNEERKPLLESLLGLISATDFHVEHHGIMWNCIRVLNEGGKSHDATSLIDYTRGKALFVGGSEYIAGLVDDALSSTASDSTVIAAGTRIKNYAAMRSLTALLEKAKGMCSQGVDNIENVLGYIEDEVINLRKLSQTSRQGAVTIQEVFDNVLATIDRQMAGEIKETTSTGYEDLDAFIHGLSDEDLIYIGARPSMGKTTLMTNIARNVAKAGDDVLIFSLEMKNSALGIRMLARESRVDMGHLMDGKLTNDDWSRLSDGMTSLSDAKIWIDDTPGLTINEIRSRSRAHFAKHGKCRIMLDYVQYVAMRKDMDQRVHVSEVSKGLKNLARELKTTVIALSQLSRELESRTNKRPIMSDLRDSGALEQDGDIIMFLYRDEVYNQDTKFPGIAEVITAKNRNGAIGVTNLGFEKTTNHFYPINV